ncbi:hypothetical protein M3Y99_00454500 [Aphelenchoides fujianensis]|nr:hypothetical protein M3Y99_00454500 [Aphelenchoides fujianensis]
MVHYRLEYFASRGKAEFIRLLFAYAGVPFEDVRLERAAFRPADAPFGRLPVLEADGRRLAESLAIGRLLAARFGLAGRDALEAAEIDAIVDLWRDFFDAMRPFFRALAGGTADDAAAERAASFAPALRHFVPLLERRLAESANGFLHPAGVSWADLFGAALFFGVLQRLPLEFAPLAALRAHCDRVHALPGVREWVARRPDTPW